MKFHCTAVGLFQSSINDTFLPLFRGSDFKSLWIHFKCFLLGGVANLPHALSIFSPLTPWNNGYSNSDIFSFFLL